MTQTHPKEHQDEDSRETGESPAIRKISKRRKGSKCKEPVTRTRTKYFENNMGGKKMALNSEYRLELNTVNEAQ